MADRLDLGRRFRRQAEADGLKRKSAVIQARKLYYVRYADNFMIG
jgi:hypothetical protein